MPSFKLSLYSPHTDAVAVGSAFFGAGSGPIHLDEVTCTGTESILGACPASPVGIHDCSHSEDAGVACRCQ